mmetsp:Transcript_16712/g.38324  ORF Transcript_16712/g.38324 Transcript_16712/m.38324 type:complete len:110 (+) Transcript_16712:1320-1649(+)
MLAPSSGAQILEDKDYMCLSQAKSELGMCMDFRDLPIREPHRCSEKELTYSLAIFQRSRQSKPSCKDPKGYRSSPLCIILQTYVALAILLYALLSNLYYVLPSMTLWTP